MKRILSLTLAAAIPLDAAATLTDIGVAAAVRGAVKAVAPGQDKAKVVGREVISGKALYLNDLVKTGAGGRLQIMLLDETTFTVGQNAEMVLDEFVYDPKTNAGKVSAQILKGNFRFVTGRIAKRDVGDVRVALPTATIGIRGTIVEGVVHENGDADVALGGPGPDNNADEDPGGITITNSRGSVDIDRGGFMTSIRGGGPPSEPERVTPEFKRLTGLTDGDGQSAAPSDEDAPERVAAGPDGGGSSSASEASGDGAAQGGRQSEMIFEETSSSQPQEAQFAAQQNTTNNAGLADGLGRWEDVRLLTGGGGNAAYIGAGTYSCSGAESCVGGGSGAFDFTVLVDFTNKSVGGGGSKINLTSGPLNAETTNINSVSYASFASGPATLSLNSALTNSSFSGATLDFMNKNGQAGQEGRLSFTYSSADTASGTATGALGQVETPR
jgi:hypothetical protein